MSDRTPEEREADEQLIAAINHREEVFGDDTGGVLMEWLVITTRAIVLDDGGSATVIDYYGGEYDPLHRSYGIVAWVLERMRASHIYGNQGRLE